jgi:hypothetical protein
MIYPTSIFALPLVLAGFAVDVWLLAAAIRLVLRGMPKTHNSLGNQCLEQYVDPIPARLQQWMSRSGKTHPDWLIWFILILGLVIVKHLLIWMILQLR